MPPLKNGELNELLTGGSGRGARCKGNGIVSGGWLGVGAPGSPAHPFLQSEGTFRVVFDHGIANL